MNDNRADWVQEIKAMDNRRLVDELTTASQTVIFAGDDLFKLGAKKGWADFQKAKDQVAAIQSEILSRMKN